MPKLPTRPLTAAALAIVLLGPACNQVDQAVDTIGDAREAVGDATQLVQFCTAAVQVAQAVRDEDVDRAVSAAGTMVEHAPDEIAVEAQTVLDGAREAQGGNRAALQGEEFRSAAEALATFTQDRCDPR